MLHREHKRPLTRPVAWSWSMASLLFRSPRLPSLQTAHTPSWFASMVAYCSMLNPWELHCCLCRFGLFLIRRSGCLLRYRRDWAATLSGLAFRQSIRVALRSFLWVCSHALVADALQILHQPCFPVRVPRWAEKSEKGLASPHREHRFWVSMLAL